MGSCISKITAKAPLTSTAPDTLPGVSLTAVQKGYKEFDELARESERAEFYPPPRIVIASNS
jgi:hypothetical protein